MSRLDLFVTALDDALDDATVAVEAGKLRLHELKQRRRIILTRFAGRVEVKGSPGRVQLGTPVSGVAAYAMQTFTRRESLEVVIRAESEDALDALFDAFLSAVDQVAGPNSIPTDYEWSGGDSSDGGHWSARGPAIRLHMQVQLRSLPTPTGQSVVLTGASAALGELGATVSISAPDPP